jgi:hypothetical protein
MKEEDLTENFKTKHIGLSSVLRYTNFIIEVFMLALIPYPILGEGEGFLKSVPNRFKSSAINWNGVGPDGLLHGDIYPVNYQTTDILTCLCFVRIYFVADAFFNWLPFNLLYGKRVC